MDQDTTVETGTNGSGSVSPFDRSLRRREGTPKEYRRRDFTSARLPVDALFSTLGRTAARGLECKMAADWALEFFNQLIKNLENGDSRMANSAEWERENWPDHEQGVGLAEAPRGALAHFIVIDKNRVKNYQMVVPTTWNASPRDENGVLSAYESALIGTPIYDPKQPLEILRTIHSFDPCLACAVHLYDEEGKYVHQVDTF